MRNWAENGWHLVRLARQPRERERERWRETLFGHASALTQARNMSTRPCCILIVQFRVARDGAGMRAFYYLFRGLNFSFFICCYLTVIASDSCWFCPLANPACSSRIGFHGNFNANVDECAYIFTYVFVYIWNPPPNLLCLRGCIEKGHY